MNGGMPSAPPSEAAVWELEECVSGFISEASTELKATEATGNIQAINQAEAKLLTGHPGAGKGKLSEAAKAEFGYDVVPIDPD